MTRQHYITLAYKSYFAGDIPGAVRWAYRAAECSACCEGLGNNGKNGGRIHA